MKKLYWTEHSKMKMRQYALSKNRILRILSQPTRIEKGIAPRTIALMQPVSKKRKKGEIWLMYQDKKEKRIIISAWRYPGISIPGEEISIPKDTKQFLEKYKKKSI